MQYDPLERVMHFFLTNQRQLVEMMETTEASEPTEGANRPPSVRSVRSVVPFSPQSGWIVGGRKIAKFITRSRPFYTNEVNVGER